MSHVDKSEHDFDGLESLNPEAAEIIKQARIEARDIIDRLEPFHISSWADLLAKLDDCHGAAIRNASLIDPAFRERLNIQELEESSQLKSLKIGFAVICGFFLILVLGSFTNLPVKIGLFNWWVIFPLIIVGTTWAIVIAFVGGRTLRKKDRK